MVAVKDLQSQRKKRKTEVAKTFSLSKDTEEQADVKGVLTVLQGLLLSRRVKWQ